MKPVGAPTRGTTALRRLGRVDRWLVETHPGLVRTHGLLAVDLGYGATPVTTKALYARLRAINPSAAMVGLEIDVDRVRSAAGWASDRLRFAHGGFELAGLTPQLVRAFNVLRQYDESEVEAAWSLMTERLAAGGLVVEGTCDETGRLGSWISLDGAGPRTLTLAFDLRRPPSAVAARLPKALIHRNVQGEPIHRLLAELDERWHHAAPLGAFSPRQRMAAAVRALAARGWPVTDGPARWRRGELSVAWSAVAPAQMTGGTARSR